MENDNNPSTDMVGGLGAGADSTRGRSNSDARLVSRAVRQRWPVTEEMKAIAAKVLNRTVSDESEDSRERVSAVRAMIAMESQNQSEEHKQTPDLHLHAHTQSDARSLVEQVKDIARNDPEYLQWQRQKLMAAQGE